MAAKFGDIDGNAIVYPDTCTIEPVRGAVRLAITTRGSYVDLMLDLLAEVEGPFGLLYLLTVPRRDHKEGRYQSPLLERDALVAFLRRFRAYLDGDGRHHLWVYAVGASRHYPALVYNNHNLLFAYGPVERLETVLRDRGFADGLPAVPAPHMHAYRAEFDGDEDAIFEALAWSHFPLLEGDDVGL
jgi:hypothetical protein